MVGMRRLLAPVAALAVVLLAPSAALATGSRRSRAPAAAVVLHPGTAITLTWSQSAGVLVTYRVFRDTAVGGRAPRLMPGAAQQFGIDMIDT